MKFLRLRPSTNPSLNRHSLTRMVTRAWLWAVVTSRRVLVPRASLARLADAPMRTSYGSMADRAAIRAQLALVQLARAQSALDQQAPVHLVLAQVQLVPAQLVLAQLALAPTQRSPMEHPQSPATHPPTRMGARISPGYASAVGCDPRWPVCDSARAW